LTVQYGTLTYANKLAPKADATMTLTKTSLDSIELGQTTLNKAIEAGDIKVEGSKQAIEDFLGMLDTFPFWFNIVTP
jgi:alkyl sulfatase BDS1-like metallo-beta-lactamase superfamily hydrolase